MNEITNQYTTRLTDTHKTNSESTKTSLTCPSDKDYFSRIKVFYETFLPILVKTGSEWAKISRKEVSFLKRSIWFDKYHHIYEQIHAKPHTIDSGVIPGENQIFKSSGSDKIVKALRPFDLSYPEMVYARFYNPNLKLDDIKRRTNIIFLLQETFKGEAADAFLFPHTFTHIKPPRRNGVHCYFQIMPRLQDDLANAIENQSLSYPEKLQITQGIATALLTMHGRGWIHRDIKPHNIGLVKNSGKEIAVKLIDLDRSTRPIEHHPIPFAGTHYFADPHFLSRKAVGLEDGKVLDQFGFGAIVYYLFTDHKLRGTIFLKKDLLLAVTRANLKRQGKYKTLDRKLRAIIKKCCLGERLERRYCISKIVEIVKDLKQLSEHHSQ